jgi:hypothetical protein
MIALKNTKKMVETRSHLVYDPMALQPFLDFTIRLHRSLYAQGRGLRTLIYHPPILLLLLRSPCTQEEMRM